MKHKDPNGKQGNSRYQEKQRLKRGNGVVSPRWMSWFENPESPRRRG